jgi:hypothetical protein
MEKGRRMSLERSRGSTLAWVLVASAMIGAISFALLTRLDTLQKQSAQSNTRESVDASLSAVVDSMLFMVQQRWCVGTNGSRISTNCNLGNPRSLERLMVSDRALMNFQNESNPMDPVTGRPLYGGLNISQLREPLDSEGQPYTEFEFQLSQFSGGGVHPFSAVANSVSGSILTATILARITRVTSNLIPGASLQNNSSYLHFSARVTSGQSARAQKFVYLGARSLADYALVTSRNLWLTGEVVGTPHGRDVVVPLATKASISDPQGQRNRGTVFHSPVFVNGDLVVNPGPLQAANPNQTPVSPITFADRVYLGGGQMKSFVAGELRDFVPSARSMDLSSSIPRIGGIGGLVLEQADLGADHLFTDTPYSTTPQVGRQVCMYSQEVRTTWNARTNNSLALVAKTLQRPDRNNPAAPGVFNYELGVTHYNGFFEQEQGLIPNGTGGVTATVFPTVNASGQSVTFSTGAAYPIAQNIPSLPAGSSLGSNSRDPFVALLNQTDIGVDPSGLAGAATSSWQHHTGRVRNVSGNLVTQRAPVALLRLRFMSNSTQGAQTIPYREINVPLTRNSRYFLRSRGYLTQAQFDQQRNNRDSAQNQMGNLQNFINNQGNAGISGTLAAIRAGHTQRELTYNAINQQWTQLSCQNTANNPAVVAAQNALNTCLGSANPPPACAAERAARDAARSSADQQCNSLQSSRTTAFNQLECNRPTNQNPISCSNTNVFQSAGCPNSQARLWDDLQDDFQDACGNIVNHQRTIAQFARTEQAWAERNDSGILITTRPVTVQGNPQNSPIEGGANGENNAQPNRVEFNIEFRGQTMLAESIRHFVFNNGSNHVWNENGIQMDAELVAFDAAYDGARRNTRCPAGTTCPASTVVHRAAGFLRFHNINAESLPQVRLYQRTLQNEMTPGVMVHGAGGHTPTSIAVRPALIGPISQNVYNLLPAQSVSISSPVAAATFDTLNIDRSSIERACLGDNEATMFNASNWEMSFAEQARVVMHQAPVAGTYPGQEFELPPPSGHSNNNPGTRPGSVANPLTYTFTSQNAANFVTHSIVNRCVIAANTTIVAGLMICDQLVIQSRTTALNIIGTFVVGTLIYEGNAHQALINWYSVKHPAAAGLLRAAGILQRPPYAVLGQNSDALIYSATNCDFTAGDLLNNPVWKPVVSADVLSKRQMCGTQSLINLQAFTWPEMTPNAGYTSPLAVRPSFREVLSRFFPFTMYEGVK